jgi:sugar O-acyltransferase (sialic acid O-acetyltransferase NeuD family)
MQEIIIVGAGGQGAEIDEYIALNNQVNNRLNYNIIGFLDDNPDNYYNYKLSAPLLGGVREHTIRHDCAYLMGIANLAYRRMFVEQYLAAGAVFVSLIHATAYISSSAILGNGIVIGPHTNIGPNVVVGDYTLINSRCSLGHDTKVGKFNFISPNVCFSGFSKIGDENLFGINSATIPGIIVGNQNKIAAGMVLDQPVGDNQVVFYRFKERIMTIPKESV